MLKESKCRVSKVLSKTKAKNFQREKKLVQNKMLQLQVRTSLIENLETRMMLISSQTLRKRQTDPLMDQNLLNQTHLLKTRMKKQIRTIVTT